MSHAIALPRVYLSGKQAPPYSWEHQVSQEYGYRKHIAVLRHIAVDRQRGGVCVTDADLREYDDFLISQFYID